MAFLVTGNATQFNATLAGTVDFVVASAPTGKLTPELSSVITGKVYRYYAQSADGSLWESGSGTYTISTHTLARTTIYGTSNDDTNKVSFILPPIVDVLSSQATALETAAMSGGGIANLYCYTTGANTMIFSADAIALYNSIGNLFGATSVSLTLNAAVSGANGLDTGVIATGSYNYFIIYNPTTNTIAGLISISATAPAMPSGYTYKRRVGWFYYSAGITGFIQRNRQFAYTALRTVAGGLNNPATYFSLVSFVPATAGIVRGVMVSNNNTVAVSDNIGNQIMRIASVISGQCFWYYEFVMQNGTLQINYLSDSTGVNCYVSGWEDNL